MSRAVARLVARSVAPGSWSFCCYLRQQRERWGVARHVEQLGQRAVQVLAGLGEPDRLHVGLDEVLVGQVEPRRSDGAADHLRRAAEVVLVVRVAGGAVGDDEGRLPGPSGAAGALRVVRRGGRDVAQADGGQVLDVDAELHRGRAVQHGEGGLAELLLPVLSVKRRDLGGVLLGPQAGQRACDALVEVTEERVDSRPALVVQGAPHPVLGARQASAEVPVDNGGTQPVTRRLVIAGLDRLHQQAGLAQHVEQVVDDLLGVCGFDAACLVFLHQGTGRTGPGRRCRCCCGTGQACPGRGTRCRPGAGARARGATRAPSDAALRGSPPGRSPPR